MLKDAYMQGCEAAKTELIKTGRIAVDTGAIGVLSGLVGGYYGGRQTAEGTANALSNRGYKTTNANISKNVATVAGPLGALGALILASRNKKALRNLLEKATKDQDLLNIAEGVQPFLAGTAGGVAAGAGVGGLTSLRGAFS